MKKYCLLLFGLLVVLIPTIVSAHGFGQKIDLPIPLYLYLFGGAGVVALSFVSLGLGLDRFTKNAEKYPTLNLSRQGWFQAITQEKLLNLVRLLSVCFLVAVIAAGFIGNQNPALNILPTIVWVLFGVGMTFVSALIGNLWRVVNPFATLYGYLQKILPKKENASKLEAWPIWMGVWPAVVGFFVYRWIENVAANSSEPAVLATYILTYGVITFIGMHSFGKEVWLTKGDPFTIFFEFLSRFSITEIRNNEGKSEIHLRPLAVGLLKGDTPSFSEVAFVILMLSTVAADGVLSTPFFEGAFVALLSAGVPWMIGKTLGLLALFAIFAGAYWLFSFLTSRFTAGKEKTVSVARVFIASLLPISIAYEFAHFVSLLAIEGQRIIYLVSNPLGNGWDWFGTAAYQINYAILDLKLLWHFQVAFIVIGHVIAVYLAHAIAMRLFKDSRDALISQYPMLILMVFYSMLSLWIMGQPIVAV